MNKIMIPKSYRLLIAIIFIASLSACEKFVVIDPPGTSLTGESIFQDEATATAAMLNIYVDMQRTEERPFGGERSLSWMSGLMADEFQSYFNDNRAEFADNRINPENTMVQQQWRAFYESIYAANIILEKVSYSANLSPSFRDGMEGEARFVRALMYFYLVNFWENVPLVLTTDYDRNRLLGQSTKDEVYALIIEDLQKAQELLREQYLGSGRIRPNKFTAKALLAKVYLYTRQWEEAIRESTDVIGHSAYQLESTLDNVFLSTSKEAIWHLASFHPSLYTWDAFRFVLFGVPTRVTISNSLLNLFNPEDQRGLHWVGRFSTNGITYYFPYKYKVRMLLDNPGAPAEYLMMFRLAEQYLIRAEAYAEMGNVQGASADLNMIRNRAGLESIDVRERQALLESLALERRLELFTEGCNRWLDLKRYGQLGVSILPIPHSELNANPSLQQNYGY